MAGAKIRNYLSDLVIFFLIYIFWKCLTPHTHTKAATWTLMKSERNLRFLILFYVQLVANVFILVGRGGRWEIKIVVTIKEWSQYGIFK